MKKTNRMIAMALAAAVATTAMPTAAFAETVTHPDGSSTTTESSSSGSGTPESPSVKVEVKVDKDADGNETKKTETTTTESSTREDKDNKDEVGETNKEVVTKTDSNVPGESDKTKDVQKEWNEKTDNMDDDAPAEDGDAPAEDGDAAPANPGDPTGNGQNADVNGNQVPDDVDSFVSDFTEGTEKTEDYTTTDGSQSEHYEDNYNRKGQPLNSTGSVTGSETTADTTVVVEKTEEEVSRTEGTETLLPADQQPEDEVVEGEFGDATSTGTFTPDLPDVNVDETDAMKQEQQISASINGAAGEGATTTATETLYENWKNTYNAMVEKATSDVTAVAKADAQDVKDASGNAVSMSAPAGGTPETNADGSTSYTYTSTGETADATYEKKVVVTKKTDAKGNVTFETTTETIVTPKAGVQVGETTTAPMPGQEDPEYSYEFGDVVENGDTEGQAVTKTEVKLPEKPEVGAVTTDADGKTMTTKDVVEIKAVIDGEETVVGYERIVEIKNADGDVIGTGKEILKGEIRTTTSTKEVQKTTTIDTYTQKTTVTEKTIEKQVTESQVTMNVDNVTRQLIVKMLSSGVSGEHGDIDTLTSIIANRGMYENLYTNDDLRNEMQWVGTNTTTGPNGSRDMNNVTHYAQAGEFDLVGYGMYSDLLVWREKANGDDMYGDVRQYILHDSAGNDFYTYCVEMGQGLNWGSDYVVENLDEVDYFKGGQEAKDHLRTIVLNGFWGTAGDETGSMDTVKEMLKENGWTQAEVDTLTPGQAMAATQAAIWYYGNDGGQKIHDLDHIIRRSYNAGWVGENEIDNTNVVKMFDTLIGLDTEMAPEEKETNLIDLKDINATITAKEKVGVGEDGIDNSGDDEYNTDVSFTLAVVPAANDQLIVVVQDQNGKNVVDPINLKSFGSEGDYVQTTDGKGNTTYTMSNIQLAEGVTINLSIDGTQHLKNGVYVYRSENFDTSNVDAPHSQTMVGIAEGTRDVSLDMNLTFAVVDDPSAVVSGSGRSSKHSRTQTTTERENYVTTDQVVTALVEVTTTTVTETSAEWDGSFEETWSYKGGNEEGETTTPDPDPTDPNPTIIPEDDVPLSEEPIVIGDGDVPLAEAPEEGMVLGAEEDPMVLGAEEELIAATGDSNHMAGAFGGMFAALAGMFMLRKKKEN